MEEEKLVLPPCSADNKKELATKLIEKILNTPPSIHSDVETESLSKKLAAPLYVICDGDPNLLLKYIKEVTSKLVDENDLNEWYTKVLYVGALRYINATYDASSTNVEATVIICNILPLCKSDLSATTCILRSLLHLCNCHGAHVPQMLFKFVLCEACTLFTSRITNISKISKDIINVALSAIDNDVKREILNELLNTQAWHRVYYIMSSAIVKSMGHGKVTNKQVHKLLLAIYKGLHNNQSSFEAARLFDNIIDYCLHVNFDKIIFPSIVVWSSKGQELLFTVHVRKFILNKCVKEHKIAFYEKLKKTKVLTIMKAHTLYLCIKNGYITAEDKKADLDMFLRHHKEEVNSLVFQCLCIHLRRSERISEWNLRMIRKCFDESLIDVNDKQLQKSFKKFAVTLNECVCSIVNSYPAILSSQMLIPYIEFVEHFISLCYFNVWMQTAESMQVASFLFDLLATFFGVPQNDYEYSSSKAFSNTELINLYKNSYQSLINDSVQVILENLHREECCFDDTFDILTRFLDSISMTDCDILCNHMLITMSRPNFVSSQKSKYIASLLLKKYKLNCEDKLIKKVVKFVKDNIEILSNNNSFGTTPIFNGMGVWKVILTNVQYPDSNIEPCKIYMYETAKQIIKRVFIDIEKNFPVENRKKIIEHCLINSLEVMCTTLVLGNLSPSALESFLSLTETIISHSNMKRPVTAAANCYRTALELLSNNKESMFSFVDRKLNAVLCHQVIGQKIRKFPQSRIIVKCIALSEKTEDKPCVHKSIRCLLDFLNKNTFITPGSDAAALFALDGVIQDKSLTSVTMIYENDLMITAFNKFNSNDYVVKNASLQLIQTLTTRMLGQSPDEMNFIISAEDFFLTHSSLTSYMLNVLTRPITDNQQTAYAILMFLTQIFSANNCFVNENAKQLCNEFRLALFAIVKRQGNELGNLAAKSYKCLVELGEIPKTVSSIIGYIMLKCSNMPNIVSNMLQLINDLKCRHYDTTRCEHSSIIMERHITSLKDHLKICLLHDELMTLLDLQFQTDEELMNETKDMLNCSSLNGVERIKLFGNLGNLLDRLKLFEFEDLLIHILKTDNTMHHDMALKAILTKIENSNEVQINIESTIEILSEFIIERKLCTDTINSATTTILTLINLLPASYKIPQKIQIHMSQCFAKKIKVKIPFEIYIAMLSKMEHLNETLAEIACKLLKVAYYQMLYENSDRRILLSYCFLYFNKCLPISDRPTLLRMVINFLIEFPSDYPHLYKYLNVALGINCHDKLSAINQIINIKILEKYFGSVDVVKTFLLSWVVMLTKEDVAPDPVADRFYHYRDRCHKRETLLGKIFELFCEFEVVPYEEYISAIKEAVEL